MITHVELAAALLAEVQTLGPVKSGGDGTFVKIADDGQPVNAFKQGEQPVCSVYEWDVDYDYESNTLNRKHTFWLGLGCMSDKNTPGKKVMNPLIDRIEAMFPTDAEQWNTLDGKVVCVRIKHIRKDFGDNQTSAMRQHYAAIQLEIVTLAF